MTTYKKRGGKPKSKLNKSDAIEEQSKTAEVFNTLDETASKTEEWAVKNQNYIYAVVGVVVVGILAYMGYNKFIAEPNRSKVMNEMFAAQQHFDKALESSSTAKDSLFNLALSGSEGKSGLINIANNNSGKSANLANYYAGMSYLNLKDYKNAISYLSKFSSSDDILGPIAKGGIGDAFAQLNQFDDALEYYEKAASMKTNGYTTPMYLYKAALTAFKLEKSSKALTYLKQIKEDFPDSEEANKNLEALIAKAEASL